MNDLSRPLHAVLPTWPTASLRTYLVVITLLATVPLALLMSYQIFGQVDTNRKRVQEDMQRSVAALAQSVNRELQSSIDALNILSYSEEIQQDTIERFERALLSRPLLRPSWNGIYLLSLNGEVLFDTAHPGIKRQSKVHDLAEFRSSLGEQQAVVSNLHVDPDDGNFVTTVEVPVKIDGVDRYVLGARIQAAIWQQLVRDSGMPTQGAASIFDRDYRVIARNGTSEDWVGTVAPGANQSLIHGRPFGTATLASPLEGEYIYAAWDTVPLSRWGVAIAMPTKSIDMVHNRAIIIALTTAAGCLLLGVLLAFMVARRMTRPLHQLARNDLSQPAERISVREISLLRDALIAAKTHDEMARELIRRKRDLLQKKADEFETLLASSPIGLAFAQDPMCRVVMHNAAMDALFGPPESQLTSAISVFQDGRPIPYPEQPLQRAAAYGESTSGMELEVRIEGRPPAFVLVNAVPLRDEDGTPRGAIGAVIDITERKAAEERLINAEQRLRESQHLVDLAQETGHVGFFHYQVHEDLLAWTPGQAKLFGITEDDGADILAEWVKRVDGADWRRIERTLLRAFETRQENETLDYCVHLPDGRSRWLSSRVRLIYAEDERPQQIIGVTIDMTEQKEAEHERDALIAREQAARVEAEAANRSKDEFLAMLSHELRNPLSAIASGVEVLNRVDSNTDVATNARRIIGRQARHLAHMMDDLLDVARLISGQVLMSRHRLDLAALVRRVIATLEITGEPHAHDLTVDLSEVWIDADATRIEQVVSNLLINAIKYTPQGGRIEVFVGADKAEALLQVRDTGVGISPELLPRVFDLFVQGERSLDRRGGGLGVGLTLTRRLVELHGGQIFALNANPGTVMCVRLPAIDAPETSPVYLPIPESRRRRVAVIEDNEDVLEALRTVLELDGHTVWTATDGVSGLELVVNRRPDVAIVDIGLPGLTGFEVAKRSRAGGYAGRMIAVSGYGQERDVQQAFASGFDFHFIKPVDPNELRCVIASD